MPRDFATLEPLELQLPLTRVYSRTVSVPNFTC